MVRIVGSVEEFPRLTAAGVSITIDQQVERPDG